MKQNTVNILLELGVPAGIKGFTYICDAMELFDTDPYYADGKICALYHEIALQRDTTASRVERAIRHAFETAIKKGKPDVLEQYPGSYESAKLQSAAYTIPAMPPAHQT